MARARLPLLLMLIPQLAGQSRAILDNDRVRVMRFDGGASTPQVSAANRVVVYFTGDVRWVAAGKRAGMAASRAVEVEFKSQGGAFRAPPLDPVTLLPRVFQVVIDNRQARVVRVRIRANEKLPLHEHALDRVVVYLTDAHIRATNDRGKPAETRTPAGEVKWAGKGRHGEENLDGKLVEVIVIEPK